MAGQSKKTIQILYMLKTRVLDFGRNWRKHLR